MCVGLGKRDVMTGRARMEAILHRQPVDRLSWTTLIDNTSLAHFPRTLRGHGGIDFYRHIGCDIFLLNGWNLPHSFQSPAFSWGPEVTTEWRREGENAICEWKTPCGNLTGVCQGGHPVKYAVDSLSAVRIYRAMWENVQFKCCDDTKPFKAVNRLIGNDGIVTRFWGPSTIPRLLEMDMGTIHFYYLLHDHPREMDELIRVIHAKELQAFECLARGPCEVVVLCENTSTYYISPEVYRRYNGPHVADFVTCMHGGGKIAIIHMCGHVLDILSDIKQTGLDGIHALTPPPTGNTPWERALDVLGDDMIIIGILDASTFLVEPAANIGLALDRVYTPRLRRAPFVLALGADGLAVPLERFEAVARWMAKRNRRRKRKT